MSAISRRIARSGFESVPITSATSVVSTLPILQPSSPPSPRPSVLVVELRATIHASKAVAYVFENERAAAPGHHYR